ncbi:copper homeostasis protein CutC [Paenibacillus sp. LMG 31457]|uniref:PF03932 family protein CutC n=1 Tax=Paenibacillus planticolens TaxID=2654976 RepID=A0ABX1ZVK8_9BACL|nr:copper homeostasis protein CutC [Paenibacillus planticolens]
MLLEVIATSMEDALRAEAGGADRIELVANLHEGGLTPDLILVREIKAAVSIPVHVMIRPHSRTFHMQKTDLQSMLDDSKAAYQAGAAALVWGVLTAGGTIDRNALESLLEVAPLPVTFHRAFDEVQNQEEALSCLLGYKQIRSVLTSGGAASALQAVDRLQKLVSLTSGHELNIMAGGGLTLATLKDFASTTQVPIVHLGTGVRIDQSVKEPVDVDRVRKAKQLLTEISGTSN